MRLDAGVLDVLESAITDGNALRITRQLDRTTYIQVNRALEAAGGRWNRREQAHLFPGDAALIVARLRAEQSVVPERTVQQFFPTPGPGRQPAHRCRRPRPVPSGAGAICR
jgi:hypothetical protein